MTAYVALRDHSRHLSRRRLSGGTPTCSARDQIDARDPLHARRLLLRSAFKQPVAELLRHEALRPLPCLVIVAAEREELLEHVALGCCIDGSSLRQLYKRAHLMKAADD